MHKHDPSGISVRKHTLELDPGTEKAMQLALDFQSTFLHVVHLTSVRHYPHFVLELWYVETTTSQ
jgi:hypothetical protein